MNTICMDAHGLANQSFQQKQCRAGADGIENDHVSAQLLTRETTLDEGNDTRPLGALQAFLLDIAQWNINHYTAAYSHRRAEKICTAARRNIRTASNRILCLDPVGNLNNTVCIVH